VSDPDVRFHVYEPGLRQFWCEDRHDDLGCPYWDNYESSFLLRFDTRAEAERVSPRDALVVASVDGVLYDGWVHAVARLDEAREQVERLRNNEAALVDAHNARVAWLTAEVEHLTAEHDQLREARRRKLADLEAHARKLETHLQSLALETLTPVGHDDTVKALARGALAYLDAEPELTEVDDG
jgi:hypothetical protein